MTFTHVKFSARMLLALAAWGLLTASAIALRPQSDSLILGSALGAVGCVVAWAAFGRAGSISTPLSPGSQPTALKHSHLVSLLTGIALLALVAELSRRGTAGISYHVQMALWCGGIGLVVWGLGRGTPTRANQGQTTSPQPLPTYQWRWTWWALVGVLLLAFGLRFWQLQSEVRFLVDELHSITTVMNFWTQTDITLLRQTPAYFWPYPWTFTYLQAAGVDLLGRNLLGLRAASAVIGTWTVAGVYLLTATLFDRKTGVWAALLLAVFPPYLHFSRLAILDIADPLFGTLLLAFLVRGLKRGRLMEFALAGACLGLTQYFYDAGRLFYPVLVILWLGMSALVIPRRLWQQRRGLLVFLLAAGLTIAPLYYTWIGTSERFAGRLDTTSSMDSDYWRTLLLSTAQQDWLALQLGKVASAFLMIVHQPDSSAYYAGQTALILTPLVPAFFMGVAYVLWRREWLILVLVLWIAGVALSNGLLLLNSVSSTRFIIVMPAVPILIAAGLRYGLPLVWALQESAGQHSKNARARRVSLLQPVIFSSIMVAAVAGQVGYYFGQHLPYYTVQALYFRPVRDLDDVVYRSLNFPPHTQIHIVSSYTVDDSYPYYFLTFLKDGYWVDTMQRQDFTPQFVAGLPGEVHHAFFIEPDDTLTLDRIQARFRVAPPEWSPFPDEPKDKQFVLYYAIGQR